MKKLLVLFSMLAAGFTAQAQCSTSNATSCQCADPTQTNCDLLPDLTISWYGITNYAGGPSEYSQTGNGANNGRLRITGSTPNIGRGSFTVRGVDAQGYRWFVCGTDTVSVYDPFSVLPFFCPTSGQVARQLLVQRVYHKNGNAMTFTDHFTGTMTFHPTHGHNHVDDWAVFTLRIQNPSEPDPRNWPIVGDGAKVGFCLMDYGTCDFYNGHCRDNNMVYNQGNVLSSSSQFPNYGLGGGNYNCSPTEQGISVGYTDIYDENLDGMWINIPPGTCNGNYWIVAIVDPKNDFLESDDSNNYTAVPVTLTQQVNSGTQPVISSNTNVVCNGTPITLTAPAGTAYSWSNGATTQTISVANPGAYTVTVTNNCGTLTSLPVQVTQAAAPAPPVATADTACLGSSAVLTASANGNMVNWYSAAGQLLHTGNSFTTPALTATTTFMAQAISYQADSTFAGLSSNTIGNGGYTNVNQGLIFDAYTPFTIRSVKVYAQTAGPRTIMLLTSTGSVLATITLNLPAGESRAAVNFNVPVGTGMRLSTSNAGLYRTSSNVTYPYHIPGFLSLTGSTAGSQYYYYFYDWDVLWAKTICSSTSIPVQAYATVPPTVTYSGLASQYYSNSTPVLLSGTPTGGTFTGNGVTGNSFSPALAGAGTHNIIYTYIDQYGCQVSHTQQTVVNLFVGLAEEFNYESAISIFPNPSAGDFTFAVNIPGEATVELTLLDLIGRPVLHVAPVQASAEHTTQIKAGNLPTGTYLLKANIAGRNYFHKLVIE